MSGKVTDNRGRSSGLVKAISAGIPVVSSDPASPTLGDVWYNTGSNTLKVRSSAGAWTTGGTTNFASTMGSSCGTQTAGLLAGGYVNAPPVINIATCDEYNGVDWTAGGTLTTARQGPGIGGTQTAAFCAGGRSGPYPSGSVIGLSEEYNGVDWTEGDDLTTVRKETGAAGTQTAGIIVGGNAPPFLDVVEEYDGSSWSEVADLNTARANMDYGCGTQTAALVSGGQPPAGLPAATVNEEYNGTAWSEVGDLSNFRMRSPQFGTQTASLIWMVHLGQHKQNCQSARSKDVV